MTWPFLYFAGDRMSHAELMSARLDGHLVEVGEAFMPADAVETRELRAGSLRGILGTRLAATHESAAWVHGVLGEPPSTHHVQRCVDRRIPEPLDVRIRYRDVRLPERDCLVVAGVTVSTPTRTFIDLLRDRVRTGDDGVLAAFLRWRPQIAEEAIVWFDGAGPVHLRRPALDYLRALAITTR